MIIDCISDLHGFYPELQGGDLLIVAGDATSTDKLEQYYKFFKWMCFQSYEKKIFIAGNHDNKLKNNESKIDKSMDLHYLCDSGTEFEGLKIWGSPWTKTFPLINPRCKAFTLDTEQQLAEKWEMIPGDTNILITHSPIFSYLDKCVDFDGQPKHCGSSSLRLRTREMVVKSGINLKLHVCGHIHEGYGQDGDGTIPIRVNASHVNEHYEPVNEPIRIIL